MMPYWTIHNTGAFTHELLDRNLYNTSDVHATLCICSPQLDGIVFMGAARHFHLILPMSEVSLLVVLLWNQRHPQKSTLAETRTRTWDDRTCVTPSTKAAYSRTLVYHAGEAGKFRPIHAQAIPPICIHQSAVSHFLQQRRTFGSYRTTKQARWVVKHQRRASCTLRFHVIPRVR